MNLLGNATKFTDAGSITVFLRGVDGAVELSIADTGVGIPPDDLPHIFDEFRQVDGSSRREYGGTGLGLSIVRKLSLLMGGNVRVQSQAGVGSTFTVLLPLITADEMPEDNLPGLPISAAQIANGKE